MKSHLIISQKVHIYVPQKACSLYQNDQHTLYLSFLLIYPFLEQKSSDCL